MSGNNKTDGCVVELNEAEIELVTGGGVLLSDGIVLGDGAVRRDGVLIAD